MFVLQVVSLIILVFLIVLVYGAAISMIKEHKYFHKQLNKQESDLDRYNKLNKKEADLDLSDKQ